MTFVWLPGIAGPVPSATLDKSVLFKLKVMIYYPSKFVNIKSKKK